MRTIIFAALGAVALGACGGGGPFGRDAPDEFAVGSNAPLVVPPDYNLTPPRPGAPRPMDMDAQTQALEALFGPGVRPPPASAAEQQLINEADAARPDPSARSTVGDPDTVVVDKGALVKDIVEAPVGTQDAGLAQASVGG